MLVYQVGPRYAGAQAEEAESSQNNWNGKKKSIYHANNNNKLNFQLSSKYQNWFKHIHWQTK